MILGFRPEFQETIEKGTKIHSIRADPTRRWKSGRMINLVTGQRTKHYNQFGYMPCISVQEVQMWKETRNRGEYCAIMVDNEFLSDDEKLELAINDGFNTLSAFMHFFFQNNPDGKFSGRIIHWTAKSYGDKTKKGKISPQDVSKI